MKKKNLLLMMVLSFLWTMILFSNVVHAQEALVPAAVDNLVTGLRRKSSLTATDTGYMRVYYDGEKVGIEYYDKNFQIQKKQSLAMELSLWGGFYAGEDFYYLVQGENNEEENDTAEVIRVIQYDKNWKKTGTAQITSNPQIFGGEVRFPFDAGCVEITEYENTLYLVTGHEGYVDPAYNQGHQGYLMVAVDTTTMKGKIVDCDLWHSFAQYIDQKEDMLYVLEQSEGSRYTKLSKYQPKTSEWKSISVFPYGGVATSSWAIPCYASVDALGISSQNILCLGTSIDQAQYDTVTQDTVHNIYLTVTPISDFSEEATTIKWLTDRKEAGASFLGVKLTKIHENRFLISWEETGKSQKIQGTDLLSESILHYVFIDGNGNKISQEFTAPAPISECQPILDGDKIVYYAASSNMVNFYSIHTQTGAFSKKSYQVAGPEAIWSFQNDTLTISGRGELYVDSEVYYRRPISSAAGYFSYSSSENAWKNIREQVKKLVIKKGITHISDSAFLYFDFLEEALVEEGVTKIGKKAFYSCDSLRKIVLPSSVTSIGESCFETGSFWVSNNNPVIYVTIYAPESSYAANYAKQNNISYQVQKESASGFGEETKDDTNSSKVSAPKKAKIAKVTSTKAKTITVRWKKLSGVTGYQIQYARNKKFTKEKKTLTVAKKSATSKKIKKLKKKTKYFVRIRGYKKLGSKKYYGKWSTVKSIRCK